MPSRHELVSKEIGQLRIFMTPKEKRKTGRLFGKPLYQEIIDTARRDGLLNAVAHHTHYGYSGNGKIESGSKSDIPNVSLNLCVELIAVREELETFVRNHMDLLRDKVLVYKHMEHWDITRNDIQVTEASREELDADLPAEERKIT